MESKGLLRILFVINPGSGNHQIDWKQEIDDFFSSLPYALEFFILHEHCNVDEIKSKIERCDPHTVVAVGGDGTITLVAQCLLHQKRKLGILPAGSANGLAKELGISEVPKDALGTLVNGTLKKIHAITINGKLCLHLSDIGHNARMIEKFQSENTRGFWGYLKATLKVTKTIILANPKMKGFMMLDTEKIQLHASMIVIANATQYGSGAVINPTGNLGDDVFEVIVMKKISMTEIIKMIIPNSSFNPDKIAVHKAKSVQIELSKAMHFQVDGEYLGKVRKIEAQILPGVLEVIVPPDILP